MSIRNQGFFVQLFGRLNAVEYVVQRLEYLDIFHVNAFAMQSKEMPSEYRQMKIHLQSNHALINIAQDTKFLESIGVKSAAIMSNDVKNYPEDSFENMISFSKLHNFSFPYLIDESQKVAKEYGAVCTPDFFGYNKNLELQYRGRIRELKNLKPITEGDSDLRVAMKLVSTSGKGPTKQIPSMGCNIKWFK